MITITQGYQYFCRIRTVEQVAINIIEFINKIENKEIWKYASVKSLEKWNKIQI